MGRIERDLGAAEYPSVSVWDTKTGKVVRRFFELGDGLFAGTGRPADMMDAVTFVDWIPGDAPRFAVATKAGEIAVFDVSNGLVWKKKAFKPLEGRGDSIARAAVSSDGKSLATVGARVDDQAHVLRTWNLATGDSVLKTTLPNDIAIVLVAYLTDGNLAIGTVPEKRDPPPKGKAVFSRVGENIIRFPETSTIFVLDGKTGKEVRSHKVEGKVALCLADGKCAVCVRDATPPDTPTTLEASLWDLGTDTKLFVFERKLPKGADVTKTGYKVSVERVCTGSSQLVGVGGCEVDVQGGRAYEYHLTFWDMSTGKVTRSLPDGLSPEGISISKDGKYGFIGLSIWNLTTGRVLWEKPWRAR
jgi:hypothetical protein